MTHSMQEGMRTTELLDGLNKSQQEAVTTTEGFVRVVAGAGSGKTRALSSRFAYLVNEIGALPSNILCVTFTNKAANEMRQRIRGLTGDSDTGYISTFHGFCVSVLQEDAKAVQYPQSFLVLDNGDIDAMLAIIYEERGITMRQKTFGEARDMFEIRKIKTEPRYCEDMIAMPLDILRQKYLSATSVDDILFYGYLYQEKKCFGLDYNDLIMFTLHIFREDADIREKWQKRLEYIMIDEFQDIDQLQYDLMRVLCGHHKNLFIVGDPDQTIYTWRGANVRYLLDFDKEFPGTRTVMMMDNYRSTPQILAVVNCLIAKNRDRMAKELMPMLPDGPRPLYYHAKSADEEAGWIAARAKELKESGVKASDIAVLFRAHYVTRTLEEVFLKEDLPYALYSGVQFYEREEIKDALSYLRLIAYRDDLSFARIVNKPKRNIGEQRLRFLRRFAEENECSLYDALKRTAESETFRNTKASQFVSMVESFSKRFAHMPISELLSEILEKSGYEEALRTEGSGERLDNLAELKQSVYEYETTCGEETQLTDYLSHIAMFSDTDVATRKNAVRCMTVHAAKGLEFPYVFLCSMDEGVFPAKRTASREAMEEERRLAFVAMTRAQKALCLSDSEGRNLDGSFRFPSRFILDIDHDLLQWINEPDTDFIERARKQISWKERDIAPPIGDLLPVGARVDHQVLGPGTVVGLDMNRKAYMIRFDGLTTERAIRFGATLTVRSNEPDHTLERS
jgi:DNA helicase-2/ATP-dependent DNA helicase PcrA